jgi:hypothetical protein
MIALANALLGGVARSVKVGVDHPATDEYVTYRLTEAGKGPGLTQEERDVVAGRAYTAIDPNDIHLRADSLASAALYFQYYVDYKNPVHRGVAVTLMLVSPAYERGEAVTAADRAEYTRTVQAAARQNFATALFLLRATATRPAPPPTVAGVAPETAYEAAPAHDPLVRRAMKYTVAKWGQKRSRSGKMKAPAQPGILEHVAAVFGDDEPVVLSRADVKRIAARMGARFGAEVRAAFADGRVKYHSPFHLGLVCMLLCMDATATSTGPSATLVEVAPGGLVAAL